MQIELDELLDSLAAAIRKRDRRAARELLREACLAAEMAAAYIDSWTSSRRNRLLELASETTGLLRGTPYEKRAANLVRTLPEVAA